MKRIHLISGLPRSGSTLLCNVLAQNPEVQCGATSGLLEVLVGIRNTWDETIEFKSMPHTDSERLKSSVMRGVVNGYYPEDKVYFDKSRGWTAYFELAESVLGYAPKVIVPVRDIPEILASFEMLWRKNISQRQFSQEKNNYVDWQTIEGRCSIWASSSQPLGLAYNRIKDALLRGHKNNMFFVDYDELTSYPERTLNGIYDFLEMPRFEHDFDDVKQTTQEDDYVHGIPDLHTIRSKIVPQKRKQREVLGEVSQMYRNLELWK